jgi:hypothetical protein
MTRRTRASLPLVILLLLSIVGAAPAYAQTMDPNAPPTAETQPAETGDVGIAALSGSCTARSDRPHKSGSDAVAKGWTICNPQQPYQYVRSTLARERWFGMESLVTRTAQSPNYYSYGTVSVRVAWRCLGAGTYTYHIFSYHENRPAGGSLYTANTHNQYRFAC